MTEGEGTPKVYFETCRAWSSDKLKELYELRYEVKPKFTYDQLEKHFHRTSGDIVNALSTINQRIRGGLDPFTQIGSDEGIRKAARYEEAHVRHKQNAIKNNHKPKVKGVNECQ